MEPGSIPAERGTLADPEVLQNVPGHVIPILEREIDDFKTGVCEVQLVILHQGACFHFCRLPTKRVVRLLHPPYGGCKEKGAWLSVGAVALFVFLARATEALVVAAGCGARALWADTIGVRTTCLTGGFEFALLFVFELALEGVDGGGGSAARG